MENIKWIKELPLSVQARITQEISETAHEKGGVVARLGDPARSWIYVEDGLLKLTALDLDGKGIMYTSVSSGGWVGEGALIKRELRRYDIVAMRDSRLLHVPSATFRWLLDTNLEFNSFVISLLNERLSQYISMVEIERMQDPVARVAKSLAVLYNPVLYPNMTATVPLSQQELGELAGLSRQSVSAALKQLQSKGYVTTEYGSVIVKDVNGLKNYVPDSSE
ncbi:Crp/Fnr family transcriptional regulator [Cupriavidus necator]|uniref:Crp/Fnr family transcriptional regulator n=1 Tax=Cupriavidus necator TaxID=106590 RepID=UPI0013DF42AE|nr:Crp/Fnr family transcriptional regulator [Cupriavidus necator]